MEIDSDLKKNFDPARLREITNSMVEALTHPAFVEAMRAVRSAPVSQRLVEGSRRLSVEALRAQGVKFPSDMRISSRYFETGMPASIELGDYPGGQVNVVNALNEADPGLLDRLRTTNPDLFKKLVTAGRPSEEFGLAGGGVVATTCGCACGGGATFCGGGGGGTGKIIEE